MAFTKTAGVNYGTPAFSYGLTNSVGSTEQAARVDAGLAIFDATVPTSIAASDSAATGSVAFAARRDHQHGSASAYTTFEAPNFTLGTANAEGSGNSVRSGATLLAFDATTPTDYGPFGDSAVGSATVASRRDHDHGTFYNFVIARLYGH